jgi:uncharacterized membrane protein YdbT with pleckstrin-like domain
MANPDDTLWTQRPSARPLIPALALAAGIAWAGRAAAAPVTQAFIDATAGLLPWTATNVFYPYYAFQALAVLPLLVVFWWLAVKKTTVYAMTPDRLLYTRGILLRNHDQIRLERVRDFRVLRPLAARLTGTGSIHLVSPDETLPELELGPFPDPLAVEATIRSRVIAHQDATGYREFEAT